MHSLNGASPHDTGEDRSIAEFFSIFKRRWWPVAVAATVMLTAAWWSERDRQPTYTAEVLLRRAEAAGADLLQPVPTTYVFPEAVGSQLEVLRSRSVVGRVVDALGLQVAIRDPDVRYRDLIESARVHRTAKESSYEIDTNASGVVLRKGNRKLATAPWGGVLQGPGFTIQLAPTRFIREEPISLAVRHRQDAVSSLSRGLKAEQVRGTWLLKARYTSTDPRLAADVVNTLAAAYQEHSARQAREAAGRRRRFISSQLVEYADSVNAARQALLLYQQTTRTLDPQLRSESVVDRLAAAETEVRDLHFKEGILESLLASLNVNDATDVAYQELLAVGTDLLPSGAVMYARLRDLEAQRTTTSAARFGSTGPQVTVIDSLIRETKAEIRAVTQQSLRMLQRRRAAAETRVAELRQQAGELPLHSAEFKTYNQRLEAVTRIFETLNEKYHEAQIAEAVESGDVEVVDAAQVPVRADPSPTRNILLFALVAGIFIGCAIALLLEYLDTRIRVPTEAEKAAGLQILAFVPRLPAESNGRADLPARASADAGGAEAFRMLRTNIRFAQLKQARTIAVTSASPGEGKSTVVVNLGIAFAQQGTRILLVDADLRRPTLHRFFNRSATPGLTDVLIGDMEADAAIHQDAHTGVHVLTSGTHTRNPAEMLGSNSFGNLLANLRSNYEMILVDAPPVLAVTDPTIIAPSVDGVLLVARHNVTDRRALALATSQLRTIDARLLGMVFGGIPKSDSAYRYYGYQGNYSLPEQPSTPAGV